MELYNSLSFSTSKLFTKAFSTSFSMGIMGFSPKYRNPIYAIYGYVRLADEIVDTFHGFDKEKLLKEFREQTHYAITNRISTNPIINSFQEVVNKYNIELGIIDAFLDSMAMDLYNSAYDRINYDNYIYGSAEVVGLMCLKVFVDGDSNRYFELLPQAKALGSAFQKVNFLRDIKSDFEERGRIYFPNAKSYQDFNNENKLALENEVSQEFALALDGIKKLPAGVKLGVYSAYLYYINLFNKIKTKSVDQLLNDRMRISNIKKFALLLKAFFEIKILKVC